MAIWFLVSVIVAAIILVWRELLWSRPFLLQTILLYPGRFRGRTGGVVLGAESTHALERRRHPRRPAFIRLCRCSWKRRCGRDIWKRRTKQWLRGILVCWWHSFAWDGEWWLWGVYDGEARLIFCMYTLVVVLWVDSDSSAYVYSVLLLKKLGSYVYDSCIYLVKHPVFLECHSWSEDP